MILLLLLAAALAPQDDAVGRIAVAATVNGESITDAEVAQRARLLTPEPNEAAWIAARRELAEEILLAAEARRLGVVLTDGQVRDYWESILGEPPDFAAGAQAAGTTVERQIELARRSALGRTYLLHRVGLRHEWMNRVPPDSFLVRMVAVTPKQLRELYRADPEGFGRPAAVAFELYSCESEAIADAVAAALVAGRAPGGIEPVQRILALRDLGAAVPAALAGFLRDAEIGAASPPVPAGDAWLVAYVLDRDPGVPAPPFAEVQEELENRLRAHRLQAARDALVRRLQLEAAWWPPDLFEAGAGRVAAPGERP